MEGRALHVLRIVAAIIQISKTKARMLACFLPLLLAVLILYIAMERLRLICW